MLISSPAVIEILPEVVFEMVALGFIRSWLTMFGVVRSWLAMFGLVRTWLFMFEPTDKIFSLFSFGKIFFVAEISAPKLVKSFPAEIEIDPPLSEAFCRNVEVILPETLPILLKPN